jgi:hypothetical protein
MFSLIIKSSGFNCFYNRIWCCLYMLLHSEETNTSSFKYILHKNAWSRTAHILCEWFFKITWVFYSLFLTIMADGQGAAPSPKGYKWVARKEVYKFYCLGSNWYKILSSLLSFQSDQYIDASSNNPIDGFALKIETCWDNLIGSHKSSASRKAIKSPCFFFYSSISTST